MELVETSTTKGNTKPR